MLEKIINELICDIELEISTQETFKGDTAYVSSSSVVTENQEEGVYISQKQVYSIVDGHEEVATAIIPRYFVNKETLEITEL